MNQPINQPANQPINLILSIIAQGTHNENIYSPSQSAYPSTSLIS